MPDTTGWNEELGAKWRESEWANNWSSDPTLSTAKEKKAPGGPPKHIAYKQAGQPESSICYCEIDHK